MKRAGVPDWATSSWRGRPLWQILADRDIGGLFQFLSAHGYSRATIAAHTGLAEHRVSAIAKGRQQVEAYAVLERICEGLSIPRELMGLGQSTPDAAGDAAAQTAVAICGSRHPQADEQVVNFAVVALATLFRDGTRELRHGPRGIGIEVVTYIGNHFRPLHLRQAVGIFGHANVVRDVAAAIVVGGGKGTHDEVDYAISSAIPLIPIAATGGAAARAYTLLGSGPRGSGWADEQAFRALGACHDTDGIAIAVGRLLNAVGAGRAQTGLLLANAEPRAPGEGQPRPAEQAGPRSPGTGQGQPRPPAPARGTGAPA